MRERQYREYKGALSCLTDAGTQSHALYKALSPTASHYTKLYRKLQELFSHMTIAICYQRFRFVQLTETKQILPPP